MTTANRLAVRRRRLDDLDEVRDDKPAGPDLGAPALVGLTGTDGLYPVSARAVYRVDILRAVFNETEGATITYQPLNRHVYAANLGTTVPPPSTPVELVLVDGKYVFAYF